MSFRAQTSQRKAEIVVVTPGYTSSPGGAGPVAAELITIISRRAPFHFTWVAYDSANAANPNQTPSGQTLLPVRRKSFKRGGLIPWALADRRGFKALRAAISGADLVWIHDTLYPGAQAAYRLARAAGKPVFATQHESPAFYASHGRNPLRRLWARFQDRLVTIPRLRQARQVTFTSNAAARFYHRRVSFSAPVKVIPNGVQGEIFHPPSADDYKNMRMRFALRDDQPVLLFVGRFEDASGMTVLRHMAQLLPKWRFWLAGDGSARPENWYLTNVQTFRDRGGKGLAELYQAADLLILPGYDVESPHVLQQALACQLPIMCSAAVVAGHPASARCLVINSDISAPEATAKQWVQKLKAGKDVWPVSAEGETPFDTSWDWLQVSAHYMEILQALCQPGVKRTQAGPATRNETGAKIEAKIAP